MNNHKHFFIIGAQRSGTTYLYEVLDAHPQIQMARPIRPEPKYFLNYEALRNSESTYFNAYFVEDEQVEWYGEKSTSYYEYDDAGKRISAFFPDSKIIIILRNPVQRAISNYLFSFQHKVDQRSMREVFLENKAFELENPDRFSTDPLAYLERGEYIKYIRPYAEIFPSQHLKILIFEEFVNSLGELKKLFKWLQLSQDFKPSLPEGKVNAFEGEYPDVEEEVIETLKAHYDSYNAELETFLGRKIEVWKK